MNAAFAGKSTALFFVVLACAGCPNTRDVTTLQNVEKTPSNVLAGESVSCSAQSQVCVRTLEEHGAACLKMTEASTPAARATSRDCALHDFTAARAQMPPDAPPDMRLNAATGLAEALVIDRDNTPDPAKRARDMSQLDTLAGELRQMPGGAASGAYFAANNALKRVLTGVVPANTACGVLAGARSDLAQVSASGDLAQRISDLRGQIDTAMSPPLRSCA